jgi:hypothetical protein
MSKRKKPPGYTTRNGWGHMHQQRRRQLEPLVRSGAATCVRCGQPIQPHEPFHLDHDDDRTGYRGASHARCNLQAAANKTNGNRRNGLLPVTLRWSHRWSDTADPGTVVFLGGGTADYYDGTEWKTVNTRQLAL